MKKIPKPKYRVGDIVVVKQLNEENWAYQCEITHASFSVKAGWSYGINPFGVSKNAGSGRSVGEKEIFHKV